VTTAPRATLALLLLALAGAAPAAAQFVPGATSPSQRNIRQQYSSSVLREYTELQDRWAEAVQKGDSHAAASLYSAAPMVLVDDAEPVTGPQEVEAWISGSSEMLRSLRAGINDFTASGSLAVANGSFTFEQRDEGGSVHVLTGTYVTVLAQENDRWKIRTQVFHVDPQANPSP
jgi:ketosteroid isomerase-like protein